jgi:protein phosphatase
LCAFIYLLILLKIKRIYYFHLSTTSNTPHQQILEAYKLLYTDLQAEDTSIGITKPIPRFPPSILTPLTKEAREHFKRQPSVLDIDGEVTIIGDLHGNILDLLRILATNPPESNKLLFLGDYVDRGSFSIEVITLLFSLVLSFPQHIYLLRGNHEFSMMNTLYGFSDEIQNVYKSASLYYFFQKAFSFLPLAAIVNQNILCLHGGIGPSFQTVNQIRQLKRPIQDCAGVVSDVVWSDPDSCLQEFADSPRGIGVVFGQQAAQSFLSKNNLRMIIRGHECVTNGYETMFNSQLMTVFSSSNYIPGETNFCGYVKSRAQNRLESFRLPNIRPLTRESAVFQNYGIMAPVTEDPKSLQKLTSMRNSALATAAKGINTSRRGFAKPVAKLPGKGNTATLVAVPPLSHK